MSAGFLVLCFLTIATPIEDARRAVEDLDYEKAAGILEKLRQSSTLKYEENIELHELLGISYAASNQTDAARKVFDRLVNMSPDHMLSYTLSPKVTFVFERAKKAARRKGLPRLQLNWPNGLEVSSPVTIDLLVLSDPLKFFWGGYVIGRYSDGRVSRVPFSVENRSAKATILPRTPEPREPQRLDFLVVMSDASENEVFRLGSAKAPNRIDLNYVPPTAWYRKWYWWAAGAAVVASAVGTAAYLSAREPAPEVPFRVQTP